MDAITIDLSADFIRGMMVRMISILRIVIGAKRKAVYVIDLKILKFQEFLA